LFVSVTITLPRQPGKVSGPKPLARPADIAKIVETASLSPPAATVARDAADLDLAIGTILELRVVGVDDVRYPIKLIGHARPATLLVTMPSANGKVSLLREGQTVAIRGFSGTEAFAFQTSILAVRFTPIPYLHLQYPTDLSSTTVRKQKRVVVDLSADVKCGDATSVAKVIDLSASGTRLAAPHALGEIGATISVAFQLPTTLGVVEIGFDALLCTVAQDESNQSYIHGVKFTNADPAKTLMLRGYLAIERPKRLLVPVDASRR